MLGQQYFGPCDGEIKTLGLLIEMPAYLPRTARCGCPAELAYAFNQCISECIIFQTKNIN